MRKWTFFLILFLFAIVVMLEGFFRIFSPTSVFDNHTTSAFGIQTAFRPNLNAQFFFDEFPFQIKTDSHRLRNYRQTSYQKPKNSFRILCLGGSIFAASGVNNTETFAYYLQKILERQFPEKNIEVINAAKNSWEVSEFYTYIKNEGFKFDPDLVISYFHTGELSTMDFSKLEADTISAKRIAKNIVEIEIKNIGFNLHLNELAAFSLKSIQFSPFYDAFFNRSHLLRAIEEKIRENLTLKNNFSDPSVKTNLEASMKNWEITASDRINWKTDYGEIKNTQTGQIESILYSIALEKYYELLKSLDSRLSFLIIPSPQEILKLQFYPDNLIPQKINSNSEFSLINLLDPLTDFQNHNLFPINFPKVIHWTPAGHHLAAKLVYNTMLGKDFLSDGKNKNSQILDMKSQSLIDSIQKSNNRISELLINTGHDAFIKGIVYLNQNQLDLAENNLARSLQISPKNEKIFWRLADIYYRKGNFIKSLSFIEKAKQNGFPLTDEFYWLNAKNNLSLKNYDKAEYFFSKAIDQSPTNAMNHFEFAKFLSLQNRYKEAIVEFNKANHF